MHLTENIVTMVWVTHAKALICREICVKKASLNKANCSAYWLPPREYSTYLSPSGAEGYIKDENYRYLPK